MAATVAAHWYQQELGSPTSEEAPSRFPFLRLPYKRGKDQKSKRPTSSKSNKSAFRPSSSKSTTPPAKIVRRQSVSVHSVTAPTVTMKQPIKSRAAYWRRKLFIPPLAYYGWGSQEEVRKVAEQSKPVTSVPPHVRTATTDDLIEEAQADDMILLTEMRAPSALGGLTLVEKDDDNMDDQNNWPLAELEGSTRHPGV